MKYFLMIYILFVNLFCFACKGSASNSETLSTSPSSLSSESKPSSTIEVAEEASVSDDEEEADEELDFYDQASAVYGDLRSPPKTEDGERLLYLLLEEQEEGDKNICDNKNDFFVDRMYPQVYEVNDGESILELVCSVGLYNVTLQYFRYQTSDNAFSLIPLVFTRYITDENGEWVEIVDDYLYGRRLYDQEKGILRTFSKGISLGNCGWYASYQWNEHRLEFDLLEYRAKPDCSTPYIPPEEYPIVYQ
ncbi:MAG: DUF1176 domain-containing protein [Cyanobacteria bacterium P01_G01_bin.54]